MREIKFRAWDKWLKKMVFTKGDMFEIPNRLGRNYKEYLIPLQYTGLKDKNGKEIYEGDIVKDISKKIAEIKWEDGCFGTEYWDYNGWLTDQAKECEIIGDIYSNPELLKEG